MDEELVHKQFASGTPPSQVALTLARLKAEDVLKQEPDAIVIGGDQVLALGGQISRNPTATRKHANSF